jgi:hypothetical protein
MSGSSNNETWWTSFSSRIRHSRWQPPQWINHCTYCSAQLLTGEKNGFCCTNGKKITPILPPLPPRLFLISQDRNMSSSSRRLNSLFSFTAIGASKGFQSFQTGLWNVAITGRTYHRLFDITDTQHCLRWYLYDETERMDEGRHRKIPSPWIQAVQDDLNETNPYVHSLRRFSSTWNDNPLATTALELSDATATGDFAAIMHANNTVNVHPRSILIWHNSVNAPSFIPIFSRHYEPLQYPLFFPQGTLGWGLSSDDDHALRNNLPFKITQREWYKNHLLTDDRFLLFGRLTSEYLCDMYSRMEEERLRFIHKGRLHEALANDPLMDEDDIDIRLPVSFLGSREWASSETADALALAREYGSPSLFITMTCNREWPEILSRLRLGQTAYDIPVIVVRAFKRRLQRLLDILKTKFGHMLYIVHVIEFQKRGFPHAHIVVKVPFLNYSFFSNSQKVF